METYFTIEEAAKYLGYAEKTIRKWVLNREIPFHKIHKTIRFRLSEIKKWVDLGGTHKAGEGNGTGEAGLSNGTGDEKTPHNVKGGQGGETAEAGGEL
jgi:excisionase family DNA binding protein